MAAASALVQRCCKSGEREARESNVRNGSSNPERYSYASIARLARPGMPSSLAAARALCTLIRTGVGALIREGALMLKVVERPDESTSGDTHAA
jgi:hypothetical protein